MTRILQQVTIPKPTRFGLARNERQNASRRTEEKTLRNCAQKQNQQSQRLAHTNGDPIAKSEVFLAETIAAR